MIRWFHDHRERFDGIVPKRPRRKVYQVISCRGSWLLPMKALHSRTLLTVRNAFMYLEDYPKFLVSDRDGIYGEWFGKFLSDCYGITLYRTPPGTPNCNAYIARWNRTVREELLDHRIIFVERDLRRLLQEYVDYFNQVRRHQSLEQDSPCRQHGVVEFERSKVRRKRLVDGVIVSYSMAA